MKRVRVRWWESSGQVDVEGEDEESVAFLHASGEAVRDAAVEFAISLAAGDGATALDLAVVLRAALEPLLPPGEELRVRVADASN